MIKKKKCNCLKAQAKLSLCTCVLVFQVVCVGSMAELEELTGVRVTDLHRERLVTDQP